MKRGKQQETKRSLSVCQWRNEADAVREFTAFAGKTQGQGHIKPIHWYIACRLVVEGGFLPDEVTPRPPLVASESKKGAWLLSYDPYAGRGNEQTLLGGMKTKNVDVVVTKSGIGPVLAVSCKGMTGALRNLTNRMEETIGESTNLHITYPALVFGYLFVIRGNRADAVEASQAVGDVEATEKLIKKNDVAIGADESPVASLLRFHYALSQMEGREAIRSDVSRYEAVALSVTDERGALLRDFPPHESRIRLERFFETLYLRYEERFIFNAATLRKITHRRSWSRSSDAFRPDGGLPSIPDYRARIEE